MTRGCLSKRETSSTGFQRSVREDASGRASFAPPGRWRRNSMRARPALTMARSVRPSPLKSAAQAAAVPVQLQHLRTIKINRWLLGSHAGGQDSQSGEGQETLEVFEEGIMRLVRGFIRQNLREQSCEHARHLAVHSWLMPHDRRTSQRSRQKAWPSCQSWRQPCLGVHRRPGLRQRRPCFADSQSCR